MEFRGQYAQCGGSSLWQYIGTGRKSKTHDGITKKTKTKKDIETNKTRWGFPPEKVLFGLHIIFVRKIIQDLARRISCNLYDLVQPRQSVHGVWLLKGFQVVTSLLEVMLVDFAQVQCSGHANSLTVP